MIDSNYVLTFFSGFIGGTIFCIIFVQPCNSMGVIGSLFIGFILGICFSEWIRYKELYESLEGEA